MAVTLVWILKILSIYILIGVHGKIYKGKLLSLSNCKLPESSYDKENLVQHYMTARKVNREVTVISANFTVTKRIGPMMHSFRAYQLKQNSVRDLEFQFEKMSCNNIILVPLLKVLKMHIDKDCYAIPGTYYIDEINLDDITAVVAQSVMKTGKYAYDVEFQTPKGTVACISIFFEMYEYTGANKSQTKKKL